MKSLAKNSIYNVIYTVANVVFPLVTSMYVSRILQADGIGRVVYAQNLVSYFVTLAALGMPVYGIRLVANSWNDERRTNRIFTQLFTINAVSTILTSVAYMVFAVAVFGGTKELTLYICCGLQLFFNFFNIDWFYRGREEYGYITLRSILIKLLSIVAILFFVKTKSDYIIYALISSLALCGNYVFNIVHVFRFVKLDFSAFQIKRHLKPLLILLAGIFLSTGYSMVDVTMIGAMGTERSVGLYSNAHKALNIIVTMCTAVSATF